MKPYTDQMFGPTALPYTIGVSSKSNLIDQKISVHKLRPGYHTTIHVVPKILETSSYFDNLDVEKRECKLPRETSQFRLFNEYTQSACVLECQLQEAYSQCHCIPWNYPHFEEGIPICNRFSQDCFEKAMADTNSSSTCDCPFDCATTRH